MTYESYLPQLHELAADLRDNHRGPGNAAIVHELCRKHGIPERRGREFFEVQTDFPIATNSKGIWWCTCKRDWWPALKWTVRCLIAWRHRLDHLKWMIRHFHPRHEQLFDSKQYEEAL